MTANFIIPLAVVVFGLTGCDAETTSKQPVAQSSESVRPASDKPDSAAAAEVMIALDGEGLRLVTSGTGSTRLLAFGTDQAITETAIAEQLGAVQGRSSNEECGAGSMEFIDFGNFTANFQDALFVGWFLREGDNNPALTTMSGIGIGTTRSEMAESVTFEIYDDSTIGTEFHTSGGESGGFSGLLESDAADARITDLWAGTNCIFR